MLDTRDEKCHAIIHSASVAAGAFGAGLAQIPFADTVPITGIQIGMIIGIAEVFNIDLAEGAAKALLVGFASSTVGRNVAGLIVGWIPGIGNAIKAGTAGALTEAIGWAAVAHFENLEEEKNDAVKHAMEATEKRLKERFEFVLGAIHGNNILSDNFKLAFIATCYFVSNDISDNIKLLKLFMLNTESRDLKEEVAKINNPIETLEKTLSKFDKKRLREFLEILNELGKIDFVNQDNLKKIKARVEYLIEEIVAIESSL